MPTKIEWVKNPDGTPGETWNPVTGCTPISEGCANCYAKRMAHRLRGRFGYAADEPFKVTLHPERLEEPFRWRKPRRVFVCSMSDLFHPDVPYEFVLRVLAVMAEVRQHTFQILTKRPQRMQEVLTHPTVAADVWLQTTRGVDDRTPEWPLPNVWLGVTAENQARADERIPILLKTPAAVHFISCEPLLGPLVLRPEWIELELQAFGSNGVKAFPRIDLVICGGETGPGARPMHPDWPRKLRDDCQAAGVPFLFKQWGEYSPEFDCKTRYENVHSGAGMDEPCPMYRVGKKAAGRLLDGQVWDQMPGVG